MGSGTDPGLTVDTTGDISCHIRYRGFIENILRHTNV